MTDGRDSGDPCAVGDSGTPGGADDGGGSSESGTAASESETANVFSVLADETRLSILQELADDRRNNWQWEGKTFSELRRAVGARDSGRFNYHLDKLVGRFVVKDGDEYKLHNNGMALVGAVEAERYTDWSNESRTVETEHGCPLLDCDRGLVAQYENHAFEVTCPDHDVSQQSPLPPSLLNHKDVDELVAVADDEGRYRFRQARRGVCPHCRGPMHATLPAEDPDLPGDTEVPSAAVFAEFACEGCEAVLALPPGLCVVDHPAVVSLYHDHSVDLRETPLTTLPFLAATAPTVESDGPVRVRVDVTVADDELSLWLDTEATVTDYERE